MRIVGGSLGGRRIAAPPKSPVRPTADRAREALFNRLVHGAFSGDGRSSVADARVLDAFCGTGALGLEALSRGAAQAVFMDSDPASLACARGNVAALGVGWRATLLQADATDPPPPAAAACSLIFLDPPWTGDPAAGGLAAAALSALAEAGWLAPGALCIAETDRKAPPPAAPDGFGVLDRRRSGKALFSFLRLIP